MMLAGKNNKISTPDQRKRRTINDNVRTNPEMARRIIQHFQPTGFCLDPCRGDGAFFDNLPSPRDWCEISDGRDFLEYQPERDVNYIITNFPWSGKQYRPMIRKACQISHNVIHLIRLHNAFGTAARFSDFRNQNHFLREIILLPWKETFINKSPEGFSLVVIHTQKDYFGDCKWTFWE